MYLLLTVYSNNISKLDRYENLTELFNNLEDYKKLSDFNFYIIFDDKSLKDITANYTYRYENV